MTDKELQKLKRSELLEIMLGLQNELDWLRKENDDLKAKAREKKLAVDKAGSIAEAALEVNGVFASAQKAADVYLENIKAMHEKVEINYNTQTAKAKQEAESIVNKAKQEALELKTNTDAECRRKLQDTEADCARKINETNMLCTRKIKETQDKCTAISSLDNQIATFFNNGSSAAGPAVQSGAAQGMAVPSAGGGTQVRNV